MFSKRISLITISTITVVAIWFAFYIPESQKLHSDFEVYLEQNGKDQITNEVGGKLSEPFNLKESLIQKVTDNNGDYVTISSSVIGINEDDEKEIFHSEQSYQVNTYSFTYKNMPGKQFAFKPGVQKQNYEFIHPLVFADAPLVYQKTDEINGLDVYVFKSETRNVDISNVFPQYKGIKILSNTSSTFWVEPITGDLVKFEKNWQDYQVKNNETVAINEKGWKQTTDYSSFILSQATKSKIEGIYYNEKIMPVFLASLTIVLNLILILKSKLQQSKEIMLKNEKLNAIGNLSARIAHDLRNPLSTIKNGFDLIMIKNPNMDEKSKETVEIIKRSILRMTHQIDDVLDYIRISPLDLKNNSICDILKSTIGSMEINEPVKINLPKNDAVIRCDAEKMGIVFSNLIKNSIQAMNDSGEITISIADKPDKVDISVIDSGPGISKEDMVKIFDPLFTTKQRGTGLGLASCQTIVKSHGGEIMAKNNPTTFTIQIPKTKGS